MEAIMALEDKTQAYGARSRLAAWEGLTVPHLTCPHLHHTKEGWEETEVAH